MMNRVIVLVLIIFSCRSSFQLDDFCDEDARATFFNSARMKCVSIQVGNSEGDEFDRVRRGYYLYTDLNVTEYPIEPLSNNEKAMVLSAVGCVNELYFKRFPYVGVFAYNCQTAIESDFDDNYYGYCMKINLHNLCTTDEPDNIMKRRSIDFNDPILKQLLKR